MRASLAIHRHIVQKQNCEKNISNQRKSDSFWLDSHELRAHFTIMLFTFQFCVDRFFFLSISLFAMCLQVYIVQSIPFTHGKKLESNGWKEMKCCELSTEFKNDLHNLVLFIIRYRFDIGVVGGRSVCNFKENYYNDTSHCCMQKWWTVQGVIIDVTPSKWLVVNHMQFTFFFVLRVWWKQESKTKH